MGGKNTSEGEYPFIVGIFYKNKYICTGTLISSRHVLTAAHCFASSESQTYLNKKCGENTECLQKYLGKNKKEKCQTGYLHPKRIIRDYEIGFGSHQLSKMKRLKLETIDPNYQQFFHSGCHQNDLAILTLALDGNEKTRPYVCLSYTKDFNIRGTGATTLGWGKDQKVAIHETLQKLYVFNVLSMDECSKSWKPFPIDGICVKEMSDMNSCDGDSGGPLIAIQKEGSIYRYILLGILSFGTDCQNLIENTKPETAVYTRMDFYQQKINEIIGWKNENFDEFDFNGIY
uniref:Peptidase S1 domain-containing protein n=1 Tax=Panagrolaimus davidi TaxID=227884 RepID=A0A914PLR2_9BILA